MLVIEWTRWRLRELAHGKPDILLTAAQRERGVLPFLRIGDDDIGVAIVGAVPADGLAAIRAPHVRALWGGPPLVRWLRTRPSVPNIVALGLPALAHDEIAELARSPLLAQIERLVVERGDDVSLAPLLAACTNLRALSIGREIDAQPSIDAIADDLAAVRSPLRELALPGLPAPIDVIAGSHALATLEHLDLEACTLRGAELLGALPQLRRFRATSMSVDDDDVARLAGCQQLEAIELPGTPIGGRALQAIAAANLPRLRDLVLECPASAHDGLLALERSTTLSALAELRLFVRDCPREIRFAYASSRRAVFRACASQFPMSPRQWQPEPPPADGEPLAAMPAPPSGVERWIVAERVEVCSSCGGGGYAPDGPCAWHVDDELHAGEPSRDPPTPELAATIAATSRTLARAEQLLVAIASPRTITWHTRGLAWRTPQPPAALEPLVREVCEPALGTFAWPHLCEAAATRDEHPRRALFAAARELYDLGYWIASIDGDHVHAVMFPICR